MDSARRWISKLEKIKKFSYNVAKSQRNGQWERERERENKHGD